MKNLKKQENKIKKQEAIEEQKQSLKYIWDYLRSYKSQFLFVVVSSLLISIFNAGIIIGQYYFMDYIQKRDQTTTMGVSLFASFLLVFIITIAILFVIQTRVMAKIAQYVGKSIRKDMYFKILELKLSYFDQNPSGDIMSKLTNDINNITNALTQNVTQFLINVSQICFMLISMIIFSPILSIVALVLAIVQIGAVILLFKRAQPNFLKKQDSLGDINGYIEETISGQKVINNFNKQAPTIEKFRLKNENIRKIDYTTQSLSMVVDPWNTFISSMIITIMLVIAISLGMNNIQFGGAVSTLKDGKTDPIAVLSLINAVLLFTRNYSNPIYQIFQMLYILQAALAGSKRTFAIKHETIEVNENEKIDALALKGEVIFKNLTFSYDGKKDVLKNINLTVKPGQVVGIVGPTGSGKTTIINLLTKFYDVTNEESDIIIDGKSIKELTKHSLRDEVSIVLQDTYVFNDNIYQNLRYAKLDATNEEIEQAAKFANADHFISSLENGYETILDNNADELSQGEKQLLAIARAFLKQSSILILDEATSSIDTKTEKDIQTGMINLSKGKTTFMIAHRLSTIKHADIIIVLKDGQILEQGNHNELIKMKGFYANMYNSRLNTPEDL